MSDNGFSPDRLPTLSIPPYASQNAPQSILSSGVDLPTFLTPHLSNWRSTPSNDGFCTTPSLDPQIPPGLILARKARPNTYHLCKPINGVINGQEPLTIPTVVDTEFWHRLWSTLVTGEQTTTRQGVTVQIRGALVGPSMIFVHPHYAAYARDRGYTLRHPVLQTGFAPVDYLAALGFDVHMERNEDNGYVDSLPSVQFVTYAYFAVAELYLMTTGNDYLQDVEDLVQGEFISMQRRLATRYGKPPFQQDHVPMPWVLHLNGHAYGVQWCIIDLGAIHGGIGYKRFCANSGIELPDKDLMKELGLIERMHEAYQSHPVEYDAYSTGDLQNYEALAANARNIGLVYESLGIGPYYRGEPRLTIGATVRDIFTNRILQLFDITPNDATTKNDTIEQFAYPASAELLRKRTDSTTFLLSKVEGGRCRCNRPTLAYLSGALVDLDLKGCYGEGQRNQYYPLGKPLIIDYPADSPHNEYRTLRQFQKYVGWGTPENQLVPGLWHGRVSLAPGTTLQYAQDYLASWFGFRIKDIAEKPFDPNIRDLDGPEWELDVRTGILKILTHDVQNALISHDFFQWLDHIASPPQRNELLDKLYVHAVMMYPASQRVDSLEALRDRIANHTGRNRCNFGIKGNLVTKIAIHQECHAWYAVNLGELLVDNLMAYRALYPKKTPLNELFKLVTNTLYGDLVSPYFDTSNTTVGNNITARARAAAWYMEKGLHAVQTITDGGVFDLNTVVYPMPNRRVTSQSLVGLYAEKDPSKRNLRLAPLGNYDHIALEHENGVPMLHCQRGDTIDTKSGDDAMAWVNVEAMRHLQMIFPDVDVLHMPTMRLDAKNVEGKPEKVFTPRVGQYDFEGKKFWHSATFHGAANYRIVRPGETFIAMRSYPTREDIKYYTTELQNDRVIPGTVYEDTNPPEIFLASLEHAERIERAHVFTRTGILKPRAYLQRYNAAYKHSPLRPGDTIYQVGLLREFSLAQFAYRTVDQFKSISRQWQRCKNKFGEYVETYFLHDDDTLDYQRMINVVDELIRNGSMDLQSDLDKHRHVLRKRSREHKALATFTATRELVKEIQGFPVKSPQHLVQHGEGVYESEDFRYQAD